MELTTREKKVMKDLQGKYELVTGSEMSGAVVGQTKANGGNQYRISGKVFWSLYNKGLIYQGGQRERFNYGITKLGLDIKL